MSTLSQFFPSSGLPVGATVEVPTDTSVTALGTDWMECDGRTLLRTDYPTLAAQLGTLPNRIASPLVSAGATVFSGSSGYTGTAYVDTVEFSGRVYCLTGGDLSWRGGGSTQSGSGADLRAPYLLSFTEAGASPAPVPITPGIVVGDWIVNIAVLGGSLYAVTGYGYVFSTSDGTTWTERARVTGATNIASANVTNSRLFIVNRDSTTQLSIRSTADGTTWQTDRTFTVPNTGSYTSKLWLADSRYMLFWNNGTTHTVYIWTTDFVTQTSTNLSAVVSSYTSFQGGGYNAFGFGDRFFVTATLYDGASAYQACVYRINQSGTVTTQLVGNTTGSSISNATVSFSLDGSNLVIFACQYNTGTSVIVERYTLATGSAAFGAAANSSSWPSPGVETTGVMAILRTSTRWWAFSHYNAYNAATWNASGTYTLLLNQTIATSGTQVLTLFNNTWSRGSRGVLAASGKSAPIVAQITMVNNEERCIIRCPSPNNSTFWGGLTGSTTIPGYVVAFSETAGCFAVIPSAYNTGVSSLTAYVVSGDWATWQARTFSPYGGAYSTANGRNILYLTDDQMGGLAYAGYSVASSNGTFGRVTLNAATLDFTLNGTLGSTFSASTAIQAFFVTKTQALAVVSNGGTLVLIPAYGEVATITPTSASTIFPNDTASLTTYQGACPLPDGSILICLGNGTTVSRFFRTRRSSNAVGSLVPAFEDLTDRYKPGTANAFQLMYHPNSNSVILQRTLAGSPTVNTYTAFVNHEVVATATSTTTTSAVNANGPGSGVSLLNSIGTPLHIWSISSGSALRPTLRFYDYDATLRFALPLLPPTQPGRKVFIKVR